MATPSTRETLKQYCLRNLGKPVIDINVDFVLGTAIIFSL